jgi:hypothetical protein
MVRAWAAAIRLQVAAELGAPLPPALEDRSSQNHYRSSQIA